MEATARALRVQLQLVEVRGRNDFDRAFETMINERAEAFTVLPIPLFRREKRRIIDFATKNRLPAIFHWKPYVKAGGLMSYGPDGVALYRRAATYLDKILKGAKPADLPVERARDFELLINLKTAKQLGLTISPEMLYRANKVIK
jgi:putative ABC transport system substrate-binding protein